MAIVSLALLIVDGDLLMFKRPNSPDELHPGLYGLVGGHVKENENPLQGLQRESKEEIGMTLPNPMYINNYKYKNDRIYVYAQELPNTNGIHLNHEHTGFKLFKPEEVGDSSIIPTTKFMFNDYLNK